MGIASEWPLKVGVWCLTFITNLWVAIMIHYEMHFCEGLSLCNKCFKQCPMPINLTQIAFHAMSSWMQIIIVILNVIINSNVHNESHTLTLGLWPRLGQNKDNKLGNVQSMTRSWTHSLGAKEMCESAKKKLQNYQMNSHFESWKS
jgi:hypothetical protein